MMTEQEATEQVRRFATEYDMYRYRVDGWSVWRLFSFSVALNLMKLQSPSSDCRRSRLSGFAQRFPSLARDMRSFLLARKAGCVVKSFSSALTELEDGRYKDIYFDDIIAEIGDCYKIETNINANFDIKSQNALIPRDSDNSAIEYVSWNMARLAGTEKISRIATEIATAIENGLGIPIYSRSSVERSIRYFYWTKRLYKSLLRRISPEFVLVADTGEFALMAAAKELGITFVEFQHGIMSRHHPHVLTAAELPYRESVLVPDMIFLYGRQWKEELASQGFYGSELRVVGNIRIDRYRERRRTFLSTRGTDAPIRILVTTQGLDTDRVICFVKSFLELATSELNVVVTIKLHPMREISKETYEAAFRNDCRVNVLLGSEDPTTFVLVSESDLHVSIASACHYDALGIGVPTVILPFTGHDVMLNLYRSGHASMAYTPRDLLELAKSSRNTPVREDISYNYSETGAMENIKAALGI